MPVDLKSYQDHNKHYINHKLTEVKKYNEERTKNKDQYKPVQPLGIIIDEYNGRLKTAVDIGAGHGWFEELLVREGYEKIYAIEPSKAAHELTKELYSLKEVEWICGFAEDELPKIKLNVPALFFTNIVFSHLNNDAVVEISKQINKMAMPDSILSCLENWSLPTYNFSENLWYSRTQDWWKNLFPSWEFTFLTKQQSNRPGTYKGFYAIKK